MKYVCSTVRIVAFHRWPDAPEDVRYLSYRHRHMLTARVWFSVNDGDREVEFHQQQRKLRSLLKSLYPSRYDDEIELGSRSCEHVAEDIYSRRAHFGDATISKIEVWEDDENGSVIEVPAKKANTVEFNEEASPPDISY